MNTAFAFPSAKHASDIELNDIPIVRCHAPAILAASLLSALYPLRVYSNKSFAFRPRSQQQARRRGLPYKAIASLPSHWMHDDALTERERSRRTGNSDFHSVRNNPEWSHEKTTQQSTQSRRRRRRTRSHPDMARRKTPKKRTRSFLERQGERAAHRASTQKRRHPCGPPCL